MSPFGGPPYMTDDELESEPRAAPGRLGRVQSFINTVELTEGDDTIASVAGLHAWLGSHGLPVPYDQLGPGSVAAAIGLREALRDLVDSRDEPPGASREQAARALDELAARRPLVIRFDLEGDPRLEAATADLDGALATILADAASAVGDGSWARFKACRNDGCRWAFFDGSKNRSGAWCSMAACGNRMKGRAFRERRRAGG
jgi:predicted RNA-binding Zn ribbon-like protein